MKCPISFANPDERGAWPDCTPECAWRVVQDGREFCAVAVIAVASIGPTFATIPRVDKEAGYAYGSQAVPR